ncbi:hypothetical protein NP564_24305, partial [Vibrio parahaemolyticus]|nr:hypothetical protein [Vibrio parahaemolyticus]
MVADVGDWLSAHPAEKQASWADLLADIADRTQRQIDTHLASRFGEAQLAQRIPALLPPDGQLFVGNSLVVRLIDALAQLPQGYP